MGTYDNKSELSFRRSGVKPVHLLLVSILSIFIAESTIMFALAHLSIMSLWMSLFIDSTALILIIFPALYLFLYRPQTRIFIENERLMKKVQEDEAKYETLATASPDCIKLFDMNGELIYLNHPKLHDNCKRNNDGKPCLGYPDSLIEEDRSKFKKAVEEALLGKTSILEIRHQPGFRREVCMEIMTPLKDSAGKIIGVFGVSRDVTEYKKLEKAKEALTQMIVHDLNNPLAAASGNLQLLEMELKDVLSEDQKKEFRDALNSLEEIKVMATNLLDISTLEESKLALKKKNIDLYAHLGKIKNLMQYIASAEGKSIILNLSPGMPAVTADEEILSRIFSNLIRNAIKFAPGNTSIEFGASYKDEGKEFLFSVKDFGVGIPKEYLERIFDKYVRVNSDKTKAVPGKGLGLTFCKMAVEAHGGRIWVESEPDKGSTFYFTLPFNKP